MVTVEEKDRDRERDAHTADDSEAIDQHAAEGQARS